ncbi:hypothetical protein [Martelella alba]|uniref:hypothetical protein n=1 Tax=Martelella alba TaxID=2590451 RepID=UPI0015E84CB2|nr:hypothetical protein [Martelella alba]
MIAVASATKISQPKSPDHGKSTDYLNGSSATTPLIGMKNPKKCVLLEQSVRQI